MKYQGQKIMMPAHPLATKDGILNQIKIEKKENQYEGFTTVTNQKGINILCFEKFYFKDSINLDTFSKTHLFAVRVF